MTTPHDTAHTLSELRKYISPLFVALDDVSLVVFSAEEHDSLRDLEPVAVVEVAYLLTIYPWVTTETVGINRREQPVTRWCIDRLVDDSDASVGMYGSEPVEYGDYLTLNEAIVEIAKLLAEDIVRWRLEQEECTVMAEEFKNA
jgi:hypothetical protein